MNFLAHAQVTRRRHGDDPAVVLGAVLPDLLPMAGVRLERARVPAAVAAGWRDHHAVDAAFHSSPAFVAGVGALRTELRATPLGTGPRRAAAHVGWELLLDDVVAGDAALVTVFHEALHLGRSLTAVARWHGLLDRFAELQPAGPTPADVLAARVQRACARRPRLAFDSPSELVALADALDRHRHPVLTVAPALLDELTLAV